MTIKNPNIDYNKTLTIIKTKIQINTSGAVNMFMNHVHDTYDSEICVLNSKYDRTNLPHVQLP